VEFTPNDLSLSSDEDAPGPRAILLTGPNMAGKSTYLRQVAIIALLAQIGSFVPAQHARVGLVDRIFTRVGADDDLARGMSTFMLEMVETAYILRHATPRSLIILDEVGRGTSALDGLALARAVIEHLHDTVCPRTLFATHYHELAGLAETLPRLRVFQMAVAEREGEAIFLHRVEPGASTISYGIQVARMAGLPASVTTRARGLLDERAVGQWIAEPPAMYNAESSPVTSLEEREITLALASLNVAATTPMEAINLLYSLQQRALMALQGTEPRS
jgi:DNA mismatch repair protein MutS